MADIQTGTVVDASVTEVLEGRVEAPASKSTAPQLDAQPVETSGEEEEAILPASLFVEDLTITGNIRSLGKINIRGRVQGDITGASIAISDDAIVDGIVLADAVELRGRMKGVIYAKTVKLHAHSWFEGDIHHSSISIEDGAHFCGKSLRSDDPKSMVSKEGKPADQVANGKASPATTKALPEKAKQAAA